MSQGSMIAGQPWPHPGEISQISQISHHWKIKNLRRNTGTQQQQNVGRKMVVPKWWTTGGISVVTTNKSQSQRACQQSKIKFQANNLFTTKSLTKIEHPGKQNSDILDKCCLHKLPRLPRGLTVWTWVWSHAVCSLCFVIFLISKY